MPSLFACTTSRTFPNGKLKERPNRYLAITSSSSELSKRRHHLEVKRTAPATGFSARRKPEARCDAARLIMPIAGPIRVSDTSCMSLPHVEQSRLAIPSCKSRGFSRGSLNDEVSDQNEISNELVMRQLFDTTSTKILIVSLTSPFGARRSQHGCLSIPLV